MEADRAAREAKEEELRMSQRAEEEAHQREESEKQLLVAKEQARRERLDHLRAAIPAECPAGPDATRLRLQLPNGTKLDQKFSKFLPLSTVADSVELYFLDNGIGIERFSMSTNFPKRTYGPADMSSTLEEADLHPQSVLFVHDLDA